MGELTLLDKVNVAWRQYRQNACELMRAGMAGGTGAGATKTECEYKMDRQYVQQIADAVI
ncbi:hypothetical protein [Acidicapsa ligni]|uniref:hypothetical protein n=1 Tax=Acidicapsa ligni TaxID=542300 RepID=UPI0021E020AE|nr:hypothetical protein [Acidicapsa ligni]